MIKIFQKGFNYMQDGPGNRLVYHLVGCNMRCPWCSNPEGMNPKGNSYGKEYDISALVDEVLSCVPMFFDGGGVTLTGGEVCMQLDGAKELLAELKKHGISTAIESNASSPRFGELLPFTDHVMVDFKHPSDARLCAVTGVGNWQIKENFTNAINAGYYLHIRIPLIGGFNADEEALDGFIDFFDTLDKAKFDVELLPYHEYGRDKWAKLGLAYTVENGRVSSRTVAEFTESFKSSGIKIIKT